MKEGQAPRGRGDPGQARTAPGSPDTFRFPLACPPATFSLVSFLVTPFPLTPKSVELGARGGGGTLASWGVDDLDGEWGPAEQTGGRFIEEG